MVEPRVGACSSPAGTTHAYTPTLLDATTHTSSLTPPTSLLARLLLPLLSSFLPPSVMSGFIAWLRGPTIEDRPTNTGTHAGERNRATVCIVLTACWCLHVYARSDLFNLRFSASQLSKEAKKSEKVSRRDIEDHAMLKSRETRDIAVERHLPHITRAPGMPCDSQSARLQLERDHVLRRFSPTCIGSVRPSRDVPLSRMIAHPCCFTVLPPC